MASSIYTSWREWRHMLYIFAMVARRKPEGQKLQIRQNLSHRFLKGQGLEIGALHCPLDVAPGVCVKFVDILDMETNVFLYKDIAPTQFVKTDIFDDGETLGKVADDSQDFIIANHFIEHTKNPLGTIANHLKKVRVGGFLYYAIPDKRYTFDKPRRITPFAHVLADYRNPDPVRDDAHYRDYAELVDGKTGAELQPHADLLKSTDNRIHFHVWDRCAILMMFFRARCHLPTPFQVVATAAVDNEVIVVVQRR